jgi:hypothetical protein
MKGEFMGRLKGSVNKKTDTGRSPTPAPGDCPKRDRCRMFKFYCEERCSEYEKCEVWEKERER